MNYDHNKKFGLLKFHSRYGKFYFNSRKEYTRKIINAQTGVEESFIMKNMHLKVTIYNSGSKTSYCEHFIFDVTKAQWRNLADTEIH